MFSMSEVLTVRETHVEAWFYLFCINLIYNAFFCKRLNNYNMQCVFDCLYSCVFVLHSWLQPTHRSSNLLLCTLFSVFSMILLVKSYCFFVSKPLLLSIACLLHFHVNFYNRLILSFVESSNYHEPFTMFFTCLCSWLRKLLRKIYCEQQQIKWRWWIVHKDFVCFVCSCHDLWAYTCCYQRFMNKLKALRNCSTQFRLFGLHPMNY